MTSNGSHNTLMSTPTRARECDLCGDTFAPFAGIETCEAHFYCHHCAVYVFHRSLRNIDEFLASCCSETRTGIPITKIQHVLKNAFVEQYQLKLHEHGTPSSIRTYCANAHCATHMHPYTFDDTDQRYTLVPCQCGTTTCVGCKSPWESEHVCEHPSPVAKPAWAPDFNSDCRMK
jgi:hypothetical protein